MSHFIDQWWVTVLVNSSVPGSSVFLRTALVKNEEIHHWPRHHTLLLEPCVDQWWVQVLFLGSVPGSSIFLRTALNKIGDPSLAGTSYTATEAPLHYNRSQWCLVLTSGECMSWSRVMCLAPPSSWGQLCIKEIHHWPLPHTLLLEHDPIKAGVNGALCWPVVSAGPVPWFCAWLLHLPEDSSV